MMCLVLFPGFVPLSGNAVQSCRNGENFFSRNTCSTLFTGRFVRYGRRAVGSVVMCIGTSHENGEGDSDENQVRSVALEEEKEYKGSSAESARQRAVKEMVEVYFEENENSKYQRKLSGILELGFRNFVVELRELILNITEVIGLVESDRFSPPDCLGLILSNEEVARVENNRERDGGKVETSRPVRFAYDIMCKFLDIAFGGRPIERFWLLETVARMPYFAYLSALHFLSTLGWWRSAELRNVHHAEELNEHFHLLIMESLGGDRRWSDRFLAYHLSLAYYWILILLFFVSPSESYAFSELLEAHAVDTYDVFLRENEERLKRLPAPQVAYEYYNNYQYYFDEFQTQRPRGSRRPSLNNLYDVFKSILEDESEHVKTMAACRDAVKMRKLVRTPSGSKTAGFMGSARFGRKHLPPDKRRRYWQKWAEDLAYTDEGDGENGK